MELSERKKTVFSEIVEQYIATGEPVGSKAVCNALNSICSPATVRNDMVELIELGYLIQPHTSAGRQPSNKGYRLYINSLMKHYDLTDQDKNYINSLLPVYTDDADEYITHVGEALAELTKCAAITTSSVDAETTLLKVDVIKMGSSTFLIIVLTSSGMMKNRICRNDFNLSDSQIDLFTSVINKAVCGKKLFEITPALTQTIATALGTEILYLSQLVNCFLLTVQDFVNTKLKYEGESNLLFHRDFSNSNLIRLINFLGKKESLLSLLFRESKKTQVLIGEETNEPALSEASIISVNYNGTNIVGKIAVIGPTRMDYSHIIPSIEYFASAIEKYF